MGINPFSVEDEGFSRRNKIQRSAFPKMQLNTSSGSRLYVKTTRSGRPRKYFREGYSNKADRIKSIVKSSFIRNNKDSTRHIIQHVDYMMKSKIDHDREPDVRKLFDRNGQEITREQGIEMAMRNRGQFAGHKLILSPGINDIDLVDYARDQMRVLEERLGVKMEYSFAYQKNTDNYHIHVQVPGKAERAFGLKGGEGKHRRIDIKLDRSDFAAMREAGDRYVAKHLYLDRMTDKVVEMDLLRETHGKEARDKQNRYDREARKDLGMELTRHDFEALKELGVEVPGGAYQNKKEIPNKEDKANKRDLGDAQFANELSSYLSEKTDKSSEHELEKTLDLSEIDPDWGRPATYRAGEEIVKPRHEALEAVRSDARFEEMLKGIDMAMRLDFAERKLDAVRSGEPAPKWGSDRENFESFFQTPHGHDIYSKFLEVKASNLQSLEKLNALNSRIDAVVQRLRNRWDAEFRWSLEKIEEPFKLPENILFVLEGRDLVFAAYERMLGFRSSGDFADSFERLVRLEEGREEIPDFSSAKERIAFLADRLLQPEYAEQRENADLLRQRGFQLYSSFSTRDELAETNEKVREHQFSLDSKIYQLNKDRLSDFNSAYEQRELKSPHSRFDGAANSHSKLYEQALKEGNEKQQSYSYNKFHQAVMKFDEETLKREEFLYGDNYVDKTDMSDSKEPEEKEAQIPDYEIRENVDDETRAQFNGESDVLVKGHSLPLPGFDLDRLERGHEDELTHDPTEISVHITVDDEMKRRGDDDDDESARIR